jgi:ketosteroid isomerase-like protein
MRRYAPVAALLLLIAVAGVIWIRGASSPEKEIRSHLAELQELVSFRAADGNLAVLAKLQRLGALFAPDAEVHVDTPGAPRTTLTGREHIMQAAGGAQRSVRELDVEFTDVTVMLEEDGRSALVDAVGKARGRSGERDWIQQLRFRFIHTEGDWLILRVETVRTFTGNLREAIPGVHPRHGT